jgi:NADH:ubiquinone oxidoreductase subunit 3 (subunit A)
MSEFLRSWLTVAWFGLAAVALAALLLGVASLIRPSRPSPEKLLAYESGVDPVGEGWSQSQIRYYVFALLFVVFDVEAVFIFPWATQL